MPGETAVAHARAFIAGCAGTILSPDERAFFRDAAPWGLIVFRRNVETPAQLLRLTSAFRDCVGWQAPVLVDQEGGRVQRLRPPQWPDYPAAAQLAALDDETRSQAIFLTARLIAHDLAAVGIDVNCAPVLDVPIEGAHDVIGSRAYGRDPETVARLARFFADGLMEGGVLPVIKHVPGHGRAGVDSHHQLPVVDAPLAALQETDFPAFRACADLPMAMTAHVVYTAIDPTVCATLSPIVVETVIRDSIGFDGLLMSDDLSMKALSGTFTAKTRALHAAGVDLALHCSGDLAEGIEVAAASPLVAGKTAERAARALAQRRKPAPFDPVDAAARLKTMLAVMA